ncbi:hypothetical protein I79_006621 [Cricetulus griseus]|uniref:Uncharacterized protein n=1 Tax=Cricetulus griseus TaxID=10029 RepID=G3H8C1_CRIGR|nr:hypothetical protein I79_006621 [Cricetulus griseus]
MARSADSQLHLHMGIWEAEAGGPLFHPGLNRELQASQGCIVRPCLKTTTTKGNDNKALDT